jgi:hypothetical protein
VKQFVVNILYELVLLFFCYMRMLVLLTTGFWAMHSFCSDNNLSYEHENAISAALCTKNTLKGNVSGFYFRII